MDRERFLTDTELKGDRFSLMAKALEKYALKHEKGMPSFGIDFL